MKRTYRQTRRAAAQDRTRQRIVEAAIDLHQAKGLAATSFSDVAARAKVGRVTVYRHFPDELALLGACSEAYFTRHPLPDIASWQQINGATSRLRHGLQETYRYHRETEPMLAKVAGEARDLTIMAPYHAHWKRAAAALASPFAHTEIGRNKVMAAIHLALVFETWNILVRENNLSDDQAIRLVLRMVASEQKVKPPLVDK